VAYSKVTLVNREFHIWHVPDLLRNTDMWQLFH